MENWPRLDRTGLAQSKTKRSDRNGQIESSSIELRNSERSKRKRGISNQSSKEPATKKQKNNILKNGNGIQKNKSFADLPPEMIDKIFGNVDTSDLLNCRRVDRRWNAISSRLIRARDDIVVHFKLTDGKFIQRVPHRHSDKALLIVPKKTSTLGSKDLSDLVVCLKNSQHFPFTSYRFDAVSDLGSRDMQNFLRIWGENIRSLKIALRDSAKCSDVLQSFFEKAPNLKKLEIQVWSSNTYPLYQLYPSFVDDSHHWQLPKLEVLCVDYFCRNHPKIVENILKATPRLKRISFHDLNITVEDLQMLESTGKLHCLNDLKVAVTEDLIAYWKTWPKCLDLQLESLSLTLSESIQDGHQLKLSATDIINTLFRLSKDVIQSLETESLGSLEGLVFPKFGKLQKLCLQEDHTLDPIFPLSFDWINTFPYVKELDVEFLSDSFNLLFAQSLRIPSIEILRISCGDKNVLHKMMQMTPNVKTLLIVDDQSFWFGADTIVSFKDIATCVPKLEHFGWQVCRPNRHLMHKIDAVITGLPENLCKKLAGKFCDKDRLSAKKISEYQRKRSHSSILDLKELKHFEMNFHLFDDDYSGSDDSDSDSENEWTDEAGFDSDSRFHGTGFTKVSKFLGFDLIPNVKVLIQKNFVD